MNKNLSKIIANNMIKNESTKQSELIKNDNQFTLEYKHRRIGYLQRKRKKNNWLAINNVFPLVLLGVIFILWGIVLFIQATNSGNENNRPIIEYMLYYFIPVLLVFLQYYINRNDDIEEKNEAIDKEIYDLCLELLLANDLTEDEKALLDQYTDISDKKRKWKLIKKKE